MLLFAKVVEIDIGVSWTTLMWNIRPLDFVDAVHGFTETVDELIEILTVKENLVLFVVRCTVIVSTLFTLGDGKIMVVGFSAFHIEKVGTFSCTDRLGEYLFAMVLMF